MIQPFVRGSSAQRQVIDPAQLARTWAKQLLSGRSPTSGANGGRNGRRVCKMAAKTTPGNELNFLPFSAAFHHAQVIFLSQGASRSFPIWDSPVLLEGPIISIGSALQMPMSGPETAGKEPSRMSQCGMGQGLF